MFSHSYKEKKDLISIIMISLPMVEHGVEGLTRRACARGRRHLLDLVLTSDSGCNTGIFLLFFMRWLSWLYILILGHSFLFL